MTEGNAYKKIFIPSPLGRILLAADATGLTGLWFEGQKYFPQGDEAPKDQNEARNDQNEAQTDAILKQTMKWLDIYFSGRQPDFMPPIHLIGTEFQQSVWRILCQIPYGQTITYGEIARQIAERRGLSHMSAQAVGGAVGHNRISILVPCHRVVGTDGSLTGYAGGLERKRWLLELERKCQWNC